MVYLFTNDHLGVTGIYVYTKHIIISYVMLGNCKKTYNVSKTVHNTFFYKSEIPYNNTKIYNHRRDIIDAQSVPI